MEPKHKYVCHLEADYPQDATLQCGAAMWVDVWAHDFDHARSTLASWINSMGMLNERWKIKSIEQSNDKE